MRLRQQCPRRRQVRSLESVSPASALSTQNGPNWRVRMSAGSRFIANPPPSSAPTIALPGVTDKVTKPVSRPVGDSAAQLAEAPGVQRRIEADTRWRNRSRSSDGRSIQRTMSRPCCSTATASSCHKLRPPARRRTARKLEEDQRAGWLSSRGSALDRVRTEIPIPATTGPRVPD